MAPEFAFFAANNSLIRNGWLFSVIRFPDLAQTDSLFPQMISLISPKKFPVTNLGILQPLE